MINRDSCWASCPAPNSRGGQPVQPPWRPILKRLKKILCSSVKCKRGSSLSLLSSLFFLPCVRLEGWQLRIVEGEGRGSYSILDEATAREKKNKQRGLSSSRSESVRVKKKCGLSSHGYCTCATVRFPFSPLESSKIKKKTHISSQTKAHDMSCLGPRTAVHHPCWDRSITNLGARAVLKDLWRCPLPPPAWAHVPQGPLSRRRSHTRPSSAHRAGELPVHHAYARPATSLSGWSSWALCSTSASTAAAYLVVRAQAPSCHIKSRSRRPPHAPPTAGRITTIKLIELHLSLAHRLRSPNVDPE